MNYTIRKENKEKSKFGEEVMFILEQKKSKFFSYVFNVENELEAKEYIATIKKENKDARHVVYIYSVLHSNMLNINFSDDGEPQGTGTKAIYELLNKEHITNICIVIVRYFGGILLGAGPLSRAYLNSVRGALNLCEKEKLYEYINKNINIKYDRYDSLKNDLKLLIQDNYVVIDKTEFNEDIKLKLKIEINSIKKVEDILSNYIS